tara:strand:- start:364 stop:549 length:186 start_codon:yes stop_codon:yes gene_type:complete
MKGKTMSNKYHLSDQALGAVMMALQRSLMEQEDIVPILKAFELELDDNEELLVTNPPTVKA